MYNYTIVTKVFPKEMIKDVQTVKAYIINFVIAFLLYDIPNQLSFLHTLNVLLLSNEADKLYYRYIY